MKDFSMKRTINNLTRGQMRSDSVAVAQRDFLNDSSVYMVNRKSLCANKPQIFYNDDSSNLMCAPLTTNSLKWSEGFLGDTMMYDFHCKYEEPLRNVVLDFDWLKISIFDLGKVHYSFSPPSSLSRKRLFFSPTNTDSMASGEPLSDMAYNYRFIDDEVRGLLVDKKKVCLEGLSIKELPVLPVYDETANTPKSHPIRAYEWANSLKEENDIGWSDIMSEIWHSTANGPMETRNGEIISLNGLFGSCFGIQPSKLTRANTITRMREQFEFHQRMNGAYMERNNCLPHHSPKMPIIHYNTVNGPFMFPILGNLTGEYFNVCPEMLVRDVIRMLTELNDSLPGIGLTTPMFSDGFIDYDPSLAGPKFSLFESLPVIRPRDDWYNRCYSIFVYLPTTFRKHNREAQPVFSTGETCLDHCNSKERHKIFTGKTEQLRAHCTPQPDRLNSLNIDDELYAKVPCTNAAMRNSLKSCNTLQCVDGQIIDFHTHLSVLRIIHDESISNWMNFYFNEFSSRTNNVLLSKDKELKCFQSKESLKYICIAFLFYSSISDGVCLVHEGSNLHGRASKCSSLLREFSTNGEFQYRVTRGEHGISAYSMFGCKKVQRCKKQNITNAQIQKYVWKSRTLQDDIFKLRQTIHCLF